jgi:hypothetical protein
MAVYAGDRTDVAQQLDDRLALLFYLGVQGLDQLVIADRVVP